MSKPMRNSPRAPVDVTGRVSSTDTGGRPRAARMALTARARSGAVSAKVPSRSKRTASIISAREGVVAHAGHAGHGQRGLAAHCADLGGLEELRVIVRAARQEPENVLCADNREKIRLRIAVDRREKNPAAGSYEIAARAHRRR